MIIEVLKNNTFEEKTDLPKHATEKSTGLDVAVKDNGKIVGEFNENANAWSRIDYIEYKTDLKVCIKSNDTIIGINKKEIIDYDMLVFPRSSVSKYNLFLANSIGLIDQDYRGEIILRFIYKFQPEDLKIVDGKIYGNVNFDKIYKIGDKMCQLKITKREHVNLILVNEFSEHTTTRGDGGFGHTTDNTDVDESKRIMSSLENIYNTIGDPNSKPKPYTELIKERNL
jgi:dUTP pyrophosphatase